MRSPLHVVQSQCMRKSGVATYGSGSVNDSFQISASDTVTSFSGGVETKKSPNRIIPSGIAGIVFGMSAIGLRILSSFCCILQLAYAISKKRRSPYHQELHCRTKGILRVVTLPCRPEEKNMATNPTVLVFPKKKIARRRRSAAGSVWLPTYKVKQPDGTVAVRSSRFYWIRYTVEKNGERERISKATPFTTKEGAQKLLTEVLHKINTGEFQEYEAFKNVTFAQVAAG